LLSRELFAFFRYFGLFDLKEEKEDFDEQACNSNKHAISVNVQNPYEYILTLIDIQCVATAIVLVKYKDQAAHDRHARCN